MEGARHGRAGHGAADDSHPHSDPVAAPRGQGAAGRMAPPSLGLDLGRVRDQTALALIEPWRDRLALTHLRAWRPQRDDCIDALGEVIALAGRLAHVGRPRLAIDAQGLGRKVARAAVAGRTRLMCDVLPLLPTGSQRPDRQRDDGLVYVTKTRAVEALLAGMAGGDLVLARHLEAAPALREELARLERVPTGGGMSWTYAARDQSQHSHDDLVMAVTYAYWAARHGGLYRPVMEARWRRQEA